MSRRGDDSTGKVQGGRRGVRRWFSGSPRNIGRRAFFVQRVTGVGLTVYFVFHVLSTGWVLGGEPVWNVFIGRVENPVMWFGELLLLGAIGFHTVNGVRLVLGESGISLTQPKRPDYPYRIGSFNVAQKILLALAVFAAVLLVLLGYLFIFTGFQ